MIIDPTIAPLNYMPDPSDRAAPFLAIAMLSDSRPWGDIIIDPSKARRKLTPLDEIVPSILPNGDVHVARAIGNQAVVEYAISELHYESVKSGNSKVELDGDRFAHLLLDNVLWLRSAGEVHAGIVHHRIYEGEQSMLSVSAAAWSRYESSSVRPTPKESGLLVHLDLPSIMNRPLFKDGTRIEFVSLYPEANHVEVMICGPIGDIDAPIKSVAFDVPLDGTCTPESITKSVRARIKGDGISDGFADDAIGFIPWIKGHLAILFTTDPIADSVDVSIRTSRMPDLPLLLQADEFMNLSDDHMDRIRPVFLAS